MIVGKRITLGAAITSTGTALAFYYPDHAPAIMAMTVPITAIVQLIAVNKYGVTQPENRL
jgi:hypothetical protein